MHENNKRRYLVIVAHSRAAHVHELCQVFEMFRHLGCKNHVNDILSQHFVRVPLQILKQVFMLSDYSTRSVFSESI